MKMNDIHFTVFLSDYAEIDLGPFMDEKSILGYDEHNRLMLSVRNNELALLAKQDMKCSLRKSGETYFRGTISDVRKDQNSLVLACRKYATQSEIARQLGLSQPTVARLLKKHKLQIA